MSKEQPCHRTGTIEDAGSIFGRDVEVSALRQILQQVLLSDETSQTQMVLIGGPSGVGKTTLAISLRRQAIEHEGGFFVVKFDQLTKKTIPNILDSIVKDIYRNGQGSELRREIVSDLQRGDFEEAELHRLVREFPSLSKLFSTITESNATKPTATTPGTIPMEQQNILISSNAAFGMLQESLRLIRGAIGRVYQVTVIVFDDLQWADESVLDAFSAFFNDSVSPKTLLVGTYRSQEVNPAFRRFQQSLSRNTNLSLNDIRIQGLNRNAFASFVQYLMNESSESLCGDFVDALYRRTSGYVLYTREFLFALKSKEALRIVNGSVKWDTVSIEEGFGSSLEDLLAHKLSQLRPDILQMLEVVSCVGTKIDESLLGTMFQLQQKQFSDLLWEANERGILSWNENEVGLEWFFAHDAFKEATYNLMSVARRSQLHSQIGRRIFEMGNKDQGLLSIAAEQLCLGTATIGDRAGDVFAASACLKVCAGATHSSNFWTARDFILRGIRLLERRSDWNDEYELFIQLYNAAAELSYRTGHLDDVHRFADVVLERSRSQQDKYRAHAVKLYAFGGSFQFERAIVYGLGVLRQSFKIRISRKVSLLEAMWTIYRLRRKIKRRGLASLVHLSKIQNSDVLTAMHFLNILFLYCYLNDDNAALTVGTLIVDLSLKHGGGPFSFVGFGVLAMILSCPPILDVDFGFRLGEVAVDLFHQFSSETWYARMVAVYDTGTLVMKQPVPDTFRSLAKANRHGLWYGDIEMALACGSVLCYNVLEYWPLSEVEQQLQRHREQLLFYNQHFQAKLLQPLLNCVRILLSDDSSVVFVDGNLLDLDNIERTEKPTSRLYIFVQTHTMVLNFLFGRIDAAYHALRKLRKHKPIGANDIAYSIWCAALVYIQIADSATSFLERIKLRKQALKLLQTLSSLALHNPHLFLCRQFLVEAEYYSHKSQAHSKFVAAIGQAHHSKSLFMIAVTNERAGRFYARRKEDQNARQCYAEALAYYEKWGAQSKVYHLRQEMSELAG